MSWPPIWEEAFADAAKELAYKSRLAAEVLALASARDLSPSQRDTIFWVLLNMDQWASEAIRDLETRLRFLSVGTPLGPSCFWPSVPADRKMRVQRPPRAIEWSKLNSARARKSTSEPQSETQGNASGPPAIWAPDGPPSKFYDVRGQVNTVKSFERPET